MLQTLKTWVKKHPQLAMAFVQITLFQVSGWDFMPKMLATVLGSLAGLVQAWLALFYSSKDKKEDE